MKPVTAILKWAGLLCAIVWCTGCASTRHGWVLEISNLSDSPVAHMHIKLDDGRTNHLAEIPAGKESPRLGLGPKSPASMTLDWMRADGVHRTESVSITNSVAMKSGRLVLQLKNEPPATIFVLEDDGSYQNEIPWGNSHDWDGTVAFPVSQQ